MGTMAPVLGEPLPVELMNTIWADRGSARDALTDPADLSEWLDSMAGSPELADFGLPAFAPPPDQPVLADIPAVLADYRALRAALRVLAAAATGDTRPIANPPAASPPAANPSAEVTAADLRQAIDALNHTCAAAPSWSTLDWPPAASPRRQLVSAHDPARAVLSHIAELGARLFGSELRTELRPCYAPGCVLYFLRDHPRRQWCSAGCGNRARVARHYARHHASP
jgi:predicted RNA-binding Zn ribbon-like protein